jgi:hypothetical protein
MFRLLIASLTTITLIAQTPLKPTLVGLTYPALARAARIQGTVQFLVKSDGIQLVLGHPMLVPAARMNLERWARAYTSEIPLPVTYNFELQSENVKTVEVDEPIGDGFDRFFLRLFHRPVARKVKREICGDPQEGSVEFRGEMKDGLPMIEIGVKADVFCIETSTVAYSYAH